MSGASLSKIEITREGHEGRIWQGVDNMTDLNRQIGGIGNVQQSSTGNVHFTYNHDWCQHLKITSAASQVIYILAIREDKSPVPYAGWWTYYDTSGDYQRVTRRGEATKSNGEVWHLYITGT